MNNAVLVLVVFQEVLLGLLSQRMLMQVFICFVA